MSIIKLSVETFALILSREIEKLPTSNSYIGSTDYIDKVKKSDKVVYGSDEHGRPFFAFKAFRHGDHPTMVVAFQRYSNREDFWVCAEMNMEAVSCAEMVNKMIVRCADGRVPAHDHETVWTLTAKEELSEYERLLADYDTRHDI